MSLNRNLIEFSQLLIPFYRCLDFFSLCTHETDNDDDDACNYNELSLTLNALLRLRPPTSPKKIVEIVFYGEPMESKHTISTFPDVCQLS